MEDKEENYQIITYRLSKEKDGTKLTLIHENIPTQESIEHSEQNWISVLNILKEILEHPDKN
jgi:hypothetical protein